MPGGIRGGIRGEGRDEYLAIILVALLTLTPIAFFVGLTYVHAVETAHRTLARTVSVAIQVADDLFEEGEGILSRIVSDTDLSPSAETIRVLSRAQYIDPRFREIGIIDERGALVATNFGPVDPPIPISPEQRSDPSNPRLQLVGLFRTVLMRERSIVLSLPTRGWGEVNILIDPAVLTDDLKFLDLDPDGYVAFIDAQGRVLAKVGRAPVHDDMLLPGDGTDALQRIARSNHGQISVVAEVPWSSVLRQWWNDLLFAGPVAVACVLTVVVILLRGYRRRRGFDRELRLGLSRDEFAVHYQPILELESGRCIGVEALLRWRHPRYDLVRPEVFIPVAEKTGILPELTDWLLRNVSRDIGALDGMDPLRISVNVAPSQLLAGTAAPLINSIAESPLPAERLLLEITENSLVEGQTPGYHSAIAQLRGFGAEFALDDFGVGFSSLENIVALDVRYLKIDKSFVRAIGRDDRRVLVLDGLIELAHKLGLDVIAEGIERDEERDYLMTRDVRYGQGWLFSPALPVADLRRYLATPPSQPAAGGAPDTQPLLA